MSEGTIKQCIQDIYCDTLAFLRENGYTHDDARIYAFSIAELYSDTIKSLAACGYLRKESDD